MKLEFRCRLKIQNVIEMKYDYYNNNNLSKWPQYEYVINVFYLKYKTQRHLNICEFKLITIQ